MIDYYRALQNHTLEYAFGSEGFYISAPVQVPPTSLLPVSCVWHHGKWEVIVQVFRSLPPVPLMSHNFFQDISKGASIDLSFPLLFISRSSYWFFVLLS